MRPGSVIVTQELAKNAPQVSFTENDYMVETLPAQGSDYSLYVRRLPGTAWRDDNLLDFEGSPLVLEDRPIDSIPVADELGK